MAGVVLVIALTSSLPACAARQPVAPPAPSESVQPPADGWSRDAQGREFYLERIPRADAVPIDADTVRLRWGVAVDIVSEDAEAYYYRVYRPEEAPAAVPTPAPADVSAQYRPDVSTSRDFRFEPFDAGLPRAGQWRDGFAVADMNGDGRQDIVHGPPRKSMGRPVVFLGQGDGTWTRWAGTTWPALPYDYGDAQVADLDGDGRADIVLGVHLTGVFALLGDGRGNFRAAVDGLDVRAAGQPPPFSSHAIAVADWNRDGRPDILALGEGPRPPSPGGTATPAVGVVLYGNEGQGRWSRHPGPSTPLFGDAVAVADVDGDGRLDFVTGANVLGLRSLLHLGQADGSWRSVELAGLRPMAYVRSVALGDVDGDARPDVVVGYMSFEAEEWRSGVDVLFPALGTRRVLHAATGKTAAPEVALGDLDADGRRDVVAVTGDGEVLVFRGRGGGTFSREQAPAAHPARCRGVDVELADLDGRAGDEIVAAFAEETSLDEPARCPDEGGMAAWRLAGGRTRSTR